MPFFSATGAAIAALAIFLPLSAWGTVFIGSSFDKSIDSIPGTGTIEPGQLVASSDLNNDGIPDVLTQLLITDLTANVEPTPGRDPIIDGISLIDKVRSGSGYIQTFVVSFWDEETMIDSGITVQDEDLIQIITDGSTFTSSLFFDFTSFVAANVDLDALHVLSDTEILVSFDRDISNFFAAPQFNGSTTLGKDDVAKVTFTSPTTITGRSLFLDIDLGSDTDLDGFAILNDGSVIASFSQTINSIQDHDVHLLSNAGLGVEGSTISSSVVYLNNTGVDTNVNLVGLFERSVPEPGFIALGGIGMLGALMLRRRRMTRDAT